MLDLANQTAAAHLPYKAPSLYGNSAQVLDLANQTAAAGLAQLANILALDACCVALALVIRSQSHSSRGNHANNQTAITY